MVAPARVPGGNMSYDPSVIGPKFIAWLEKTTGESDITTTTALSDIGYDGYNIYSLGQQIDELSWLHGVDITPVEIGQCTKVQDVINLICNK
jgi:hypothetical protein